MSDEMDQLIADVTKGTDLEGSVGSAEGNQSNPAPKKQQQQQDAEGGKDDAGNRREDFDESEYGGEDDENFDPSKATPEQRKLWPKKYTNALSRQQKNNTRLSADLQAAQTRIAALEAQTNKAEVKVEKADEISAELQAEKPLLKDFKDFGEYNDAVAVWNRKVALATFRAEQAAKDLEAAKAQEGKTLQETATANETRVAKQTEEFVKNNPEALQLMVANSDLITSLPDAIMDECGKLAHPEVAIYELCQKEGALAALRLCDPAVARIVFANAEKIGLAKMAEGGQQGEEGGEGNETDDTPRVSSAPTPMTKVKSSPSGKKQLKDLPDAELFKELGIE